MKKSRGKTVPAAAERPEDRAWRTVVGTWVLVKEYPAEQMAGLLHKAETFQERTFEGRVAAVGDEVTKFHVGQDVFWKPFTGYDRPGATQADIFVVLKEEEIIGQVDREGRAKFMAAKQRADDKREADARESLAAGRAGMLDPQLPER